MTDVLKDALAFMRKQSLPELVEPDFEKFYAAYPQHRKKLKKELIEREGKTFSLYWNAQLKGIRRIEAAPAKVKPAATSSKIDKSNDDATILATVKKFMAKRNINELSAEQFHAKHPNFAGRLTERLVESIGLKHNLCWDRGLQVVCLADSKPSALATSSIVVDKPRLTETTGNGDEESKAFSDKYCDYEQKIIDTKEASVDAVSALSQSKYIAVDFERAGRGSSEHVSLIQFAAKNAAGRVVVYIFDPIECADCVRHSGLEKILTSSGHVKIIHDCSRDSEVLSKEYSMDLVCVFDTQVAYSVLENKTSNYKVGLNVVLENYGGAVNTLKENVDHSVDLWDIRPLSEELLSYAAQDVAYLLDTHQKMLDVLSLRGQIEVVMERSANKLFAPPVLVKKGYASILNPSIQLEDRRYLEFQDDGTPRLSLSEPDLADLLTECAKNSDDSYEEIMLLFGILPKKIKDALNQSFERIYSAVTEVVLDLERKPLVRFTSEGEDRVSMCNDLNCDKVTKDDLEYICNQIGHFSSDNRGGLPGTLHRVSQKLNRSGDAIALTLRIGRAVNGSTAMITDIVKSKRSVLLLGIPGVGKTTLLREYARLVADQDNTRVEIIDTSNEIAGDGDVPHKSVGKARRMMVCDRNQQYKVMIEAVQNHMPEFIIVDEIGTRQEAQAVADISQRGVKIVATAHGIELADMLRNPELSRLMGGTHTVVLGDEEMRARNCRSKSVRERKAPPVFDTVIELRGQREWVVYHDCCAAVDDILADLTPEAEIRHMDSRGIMTVRKSKSIST